MKASRLKCSGPLSQANTPRKSCCYCFSAHYFYVWDFNTATADAVSLTFSHIGVATMPTATAGSIMTADVVTVRPSASIEEAIELTLSEGISGLPVTDPHGRLIGLLTDFA